MGQQLTVTLPDALAESLRARVLSGEFASIDEAVADALLLQDETPAHTDAEIERWLRTEVVARYDRLLADPSNVRSPQEVQARLDEEYAKLVSRDD